MTAWRAQEDRQGLHPAFELFVCCDTPEFMVVRLV
jgi:hypothetical protein